MFKLIVVGILFLVCGMLKLPVYAENNNESIAKIASDSTTYRTINMQIGKTYSGRLKQDENYPRYYDGVLYKFTLTKSGKVNFSTYTESANIYYNILDEDGKEIYSGCSGVMYYNDKLGMGRDNFYYHISKGTYYLQITTTYFYSSEHSELSFKIATTFTDANINENEPNDDFRNATLLGIEGKTRGQFSISNVKDVYKINVNKKQALTLKFTSADIGKYDIEVCDKLGNSLYTDSYIGDKA